jgi:uncharacterized protein YyaL (SSP411 family)
MNNKHTNDLIHETSPYLLQHAHNPVNWQPWSKAALQKAKLENKMLLVSIGYSACHWCHVMERESFEDEATAQIMNENFINIKIDREERPDIDHIYMDAVQAISGSGGWPLNVFLTPDAKPFYGGTYFPPVNAFNRSSWTDVLKSIINAWQEKRDEIEAQANNLIDHLNKSANFSNKNIVDVPIDNTFNFDQCEQAFSVIMKTADKTWGGFGRAPKFPQTFTIQYLLQFYHYSNNNDALQQALLSLNKMLDGGIYDHVGGGLARYSTDEEWLAPHFEKMLYDNALLLLVLCDAFQVTGSTRYELAIEKTISFVTTELLHKSSGFYAALDADSEGEEGKFYVWEKSEIEEILGKDADIFCSYFDVTEEGNWEGKNILRILKQIDGFAKEQGLDVSDFQKFLDTCLQKLALERDKRIKPGLDDKIILGWNALLLKAIAKSAIVLQNENYKILATENFNFLISNFRISASWSMLHTWKNGVAKYPAFLDDYAYLIDAMIQLYELDFETKYLHDALNFCSFVIENFSDEEDLFFYYTHKEQDDLILRKKEISDGAIPSGNSIMANNLSKLAIIFDRRDWAVRSDKMMLSISGAATKYPTSFGIWSSLFLQKTKGIDEIAVVGNESKHIARQIQTRQYFPNKIIIASEFETDEFPLLNGKMGNGASQIYLCKNYVCKAPFGNVELLIDALKKA